MMLITPRIHLIAFASLAIANSAEAAPIVWGNSAGNVAPAFGLGHVWLEAFDMDPAIGTPNRVAVIQAPTPGVDFPNGRGIAVVGDLIYYSRAFTYENTDGGKVFVWNKATNSFAGTIDLEEPPDGIPLGGIGTLTWDGSALWVSPYDAKPGIDHRDFYRYSTSGQLLSFIPGFFDDGSPPGVDSKAATDGVEIVGNRIIANRGDHTAPYDVYDFNGNLIQSAFIDPAAWGLTPDTTGIAFDGASYWLSDIINNQLFQFDVNGNYVKTVILTPVAQPDGSGRNIEDLAFARVFVPEPSTLELLGMALAGVSWMVYQWRNV